MEIEVTSQKENPLLKRTEVRFRIAHPKERTPKRSVVRGELAALLGVKKGLVIIDHLDVEFGISETRGYAKAYHTEEMMLKTEREHILKRAGVSARGTQPGKEKAPAGKPADETSAGPPAGKDDAHPEPAEEEPEENEVAREETEDSGEETGPDDIEDGPDDGSEDPSDDDRKEGD